MKDIYADGPFAWKGTKCAKWRSLNERDGWRWNKSTLQLTFFFLNPIHLFFFFFFLSERKGNLHDGKWVVAEHSACSLSLPPWLCLLAVLPYCSSQAISGSFITPFWAKVGPWRINFVIILTVTQFMGGEKMYSVKFTLNVWHFAFVTVEKKYAPF